MAEPAMATVLVIDDRASNREFLSTLLGSGGFRVLEAADGAEGLAQMRKETPNLVIADILMPTMDGHDFVRRIREDPAIAHTRVVLYTAIYHEREARNLAESCGIKHVLTKPSEPETVLELVRRVLGMPGRETVEREHPQLVTDKLIRTADDLSRINLRFEALIDINLQLVSERDPGRLLEDVCRAARALIGAKYAILAIGNHDQSEAGYFVTAGMDAETVRQLEPPVLDAGAVGVTLRKGKPQRLVNPEGDTRAAGLPAGHPPVHSLLTAPISSPKQTYGWICLSNRMGAQEFSAEDEHLLAILAAQVGRIYENDSLYREVQQSERRYSDLLEKVELASLMLDKQARIIYCNDFLLRLTGWNREEVSGRDWFELFIPPDLEDLRSVFDDMIQDKPAARIHENEILTRAGERRLVRWNNSTLRSADNEVIGTASIGEDITEQKRQEISIRRLNRVYAVLSGINTLIVRVRDRRQLFEDACRIAVEEGGFGLAWIGVPDHDAGIVTPITIHGPQQDRELISQIRFSTREGRAQDHTTVGEAVRTKRPSFNNDLGVPPVEDPLFGEFSRRGYRSVISLPLLSGETCTGVAVFYSRECGFFDTPEVALLSELAGDISFSLDFIESEEKVTFLAYHDPMTGLGNRASMRRRLAEAIGLADARGDSFALMLMNINNFREINETLGHSNGDALLGDIAKRLSGAMWKSDMVACLGGDEFAILIPRLSRKGDIDLVLAKVEEVLHKPFLAAGLPINVEASIGIALYPDHGNSPDLLWQRADVALRSTKDRRVNHCYYDAGIDHYDAERLALMGEFRGAIDRNELVLHWQPSVDVATQRTIGAEALLRWQHPEHGLIYPDRFLPYVERTGLIHPLTAWVLANAMSQGHAWHENGFRLNLSVKISVRNLQNPNLATEILGMARSAPFPPERLTVEITESAIMEDPLRSRALLVELHTAGIRISMDDFGIGQSSLKYLKDLPISQMKVDKSFLIGYQEPHNRTIVRSAIALGHELEMTITAEGVEDEATFLALRELGCDVVQGYYFCKPLPPDAFIAWLRGSQWPFADEPGI
jgi:diguanylate cyclase (GGDEF)-like protein/PAS domain S-box-containing protein